MSQRGRIEDETEMAESHKTIKKCHIHPKIKRNDICNMHEVNEAYIQTIKSVLH